jgi:hydroxycarboxylate dehydrogenase B
MPTIPYNRLEEFAISLLHAGGATEQEAEIVGRSLVAANLCGYDSHGVMRIPFYIQALAQGETVSEAELTILRDSLTHVVADGNWGFGQVQCGRVTEMAIEKARQSGVGVATLYNTSHVGRLGDYCETAAAHGLLSIMMVNTHGAARRVAPPGGTAPRLGTNPIALGAPTGGEPLILDFSTSATAEGKVRVKMIAGEQCPEGWLLDNAGKPTTDPKTLYGDPPGSILPMGGTQGYKGFGLALLIDAFAGALSGGLCAREKPLTPKGNCVFLLVCAPEHFGGQAHYVQEVQQMVEFVKQCPRAEGVDEILLPGDPERRCRQARQQDGIPLDEENWARLLELAIDLKLPPPA